MTKTDTPNRPTHRLYSVRKSGSEKAYWTQIGAAWENQDGKGFNIKLNLLPLDGTEIVMREVKDEPDAS